MQENTQVNLEIQPQPRGPLPEVRLKPAEKKEEKLSELATHLLLQKYNKLADKIRNIKNKFLALPFCQKTIQAKNTLVKLKEKYTDKEQNQARLTALKTQSAAQVKKIFTGLDQKTKFSEKTAPVKKFFNKAFWTGKISEVQEDIKDIGQQIKNILASMIKSQMDKKNSENIKP